MRCTGAAPVRACSEHAPFAVKRQHAGRERGQPEPQHPDARQLLRLSALQRQQPAMGAPETEQIAICIEARSRSLFSPTQDLSVVKPLPTEQLRPSTQSLTAGMH